LKSPQASVSTILFTVRTVPFNESFVDVALEGTVKVQAVVDILAKIRVALDVCVEAVAKLDLKASTVLVLKGEVQVVAQIAALLSVLIHVVVKIVVAVLKVKVLADVSVVISVCTAIW